LREADRRKDEFLATLSHELRNPLAPLRNALHLMQALQPDGGVLTQARDIMERQVNHLVRLVDDLLEMGRISRGTLEMRFERVEVATIVHHAVEASGPLIQAAQHGLEVSIPDEPIWLEGDPVRLTQIVTNVVNNAVKYTPPGGHIAIAAERDGTHVAIRVRDNGAGIEREALERIFEMFAREQRPDAPQQAGLGIGLALSRRLAELHGGTLHAHSDGVRQGSTFTLRLPIAAPQFVIGADDMTLGALGSADILPLE